jgi:gamma-glutamyltranspeptidase / glutathione hydrolase
VISDRRGIVVAPQRVAAEAGAAALAAGGTTVDAAVAAAFVLCVTDPANCGVGGYGGFLVHAPADGAPVLVDFNTWVPGGAEPSSFRVPGDDANPARGGRSVAPPNVVPGLLAAHARLGRLPLAQLLEPAVEKARDGFAVGRDVARAFAKHWAQSGGGAPEFARIFFPAGRPLSEGETLVQAELGATLEQLGREPDLFVSGGLVDAICAAAGPDEGCLDAAEFADDRVQVGASATTTFGAATIHAPHEATSGAGVVFGALARIDPDRLEGDRSRGYVEEVRSALAASWRERGLGASVPHTATLCAADASGAVTSLTFTHGEWCGSGIVVPGTGVILNGGANLFAVTSDGPAAVTNMCPVVFEIEDGARHGLGATGGPRIPAIVLTAIVDVVHGGATLAEAIAAPHVAVRATDGVLQGEPAVLEAAGGGLPIGPGDYGAAAGVTVAADGTLLPAVDSRFDSAAAEA